MKAIPYLPTSLLLFLCGLNLYLAIIAGPEHSFMMFMIFSVVYLTLGVLFIRKIKFAELVGFIFSFAIIFVYPSIVDFENLHPWSSGLLGAINAIVAIYCLYLLMIRIKD
jgi:hypothetical protein